MKICRGLVYIILAALLGCAGDKHLVTSDSGINPPKYGTADEGVFPRDRVLDIRISMSVGAWKRMLATATREVWSTADVTIDGRRLGMVGFRPKGEYSLDTCIDAYGRLLCKKLSFKLKFHAVDPGLRFYGLKRLVLNKIENGAEVFFETLGYRIFNDFGIIAPRTGYATLTINGKPQGLYTVVEVVDGRFTKDRFEDGDGNLYKEVWPNRTEASYFAYGLENNEETATHDAFIAFATDMLATGDETLPETLARYMDIEKVLDYMAVDYGIANWDGITTFYAGEWGCSNHNYYMYQDENTARFTLIPWDLNAVFFLEHWLGDIRPWDTLNVDCGRLIPVENIPDLYTRPSCCDPVIRAIALSKDRYRASLRRLLEEVFVPDRLNVLIDALFSQIKPALKKDPFLRVNDVAGAAWWLKGNLKILRKRLQAAASSGETGGGSP
ncbi:MAG: CotH kinase family protein [Spirochaetales bacterium]|nr:CotH kinase family protein [Spirochaetales bacterium]